LFQKLLEATYSGDEDYEIDRDLINIILAEHTTEQKDTSTAAVIVSNFINAHLTCMAMGRRFDDRELELLQMITDQMDEVVFGAYECYSLDKNEDELLETLRVLIKLEIEEEELDCMSCDYQSSRGKQESKHSDYQRDSWPMGFEKMVDRTKASNIMETFKDMMSTVKYSILQSVVLINIANRTRGAILHRSNTLLYAYSKRE
jgi:hypothetical protein